MKGDERVELLEEGADCLLFDNSWHENLLLQKMGGIQFVGRISRGSDCFRENGGHYPFKLNCIFPIGVIVINLMPIHWEKFRNNAVSDVVGHKSAELKIRVWMALERDIALTHDVSSRINVIRLNRFWVLKKHSGDGYPVLPSEGSVVALIDSIELVPQPTLFPIFSGRLPKRREDLEVRSAHLHALTWEQRKLGELVEETYGGGTPKTSVPEYWGGDIPWIQSSNVIEGELFNIDIPKAITDKGLRESAAILIPGSSIAVVTHVGVGKLVYLPFSFTTSQDFVSLSRLKTNSIFLCYALFRRLQTEINMVQGSAIKGITKAELLDKRIDIPHDVEQTQIGAFFQKLDSLIALHQRERVEQFAQSGSPFNNACKHRAV